MVFLVFEITEKSRNKRFLGFHSLSLSQYPVYLVRDTLYISLSDFLLRWSLLFTLFMAMQFAFIDFGVNGYYRLSAMLMLCACVYQPYLTKMHMQCMLEMTLNGIIMLNGVPWRAEKMHTHIHMCICASIFMLGVDICLRCAPVS